MSRLVISCHVMSCHVMSCHVTSCHIMSCHAMPCHAMPCHVMSCHVMSCHVILLENLAPGFLNSSIMRRTVAMCGNPAERRSRCGAVRTRGPRNHFSTWASFCVAGWGDTQSAATFQETSAPSSHPQTTDSLRLPQFRNVQRAPAHASCLARATKSSDLRDCARFIAPATRIHRLVPSRAHQHPKSHTCHAKRRSQCVKSCMRARDTPRTQFLRQSAASTAPEHTPDTLPATRSAQSATRNTLTMRKQNQNPIPTALRHTCDTHTMS